LIEKREREREKERKGKETAAKKKSTLSTKWSFVSLPSSARPISLLLACCSGLALPFQVRGSEPRNSLRSLHAEWSGVFTPFVYAKGRRKEQKKARRLLFFDPPCLERKEKSQLLVRCLFHNLVPKCDANANIML
jgi:hypothetical protein